MQKEQYKVIKVTHTTYNYTKSSLYRDYNRLKVLKQLILIKLYKLIVHLQQEPRRQIADLVIYLIQSILDNNKAQLHNNINISCNIIVLEVQYKVLKGSIQVYRGYKVVINTTKDFLDKLQDQSQYSRPDQGFISQHY